MPNGSLRIYFAFIAVMQLLEPKRSIAKSVDAEISLFASMALS